MIVLYQFEISPFCEKIRRLLHFKGQPYRAIEVRPSSAGRRRLRAAVDATGQLPVLEHGGRRIDDSSDIARYLEHTFPEPAVLPSSATECALAHVLEDWADESLYFFERTMRLTWGGNARRWMPELVKYERAPLRALMRQSLPRAIARTVRLQGLGRKPPERVESELARHIGAIESWLREREWLVGEQLTLADIAVSVQLACVQQTHEGARSIEATPLVGAWLERVEQATRSPASAH